MRIESGFTLIELLVVVAIIGVLAGIAIPQYSAYRISGFDARARVDLRNAVTAQEASFTSRELYADCMNNGCNSPTLPGMVVSDGVSISCTPRNGAAIFQCSTRHAQGTITFYYDSENSVFWEM